MIFIHIVKLLLNRYLVDKEAYIKRENERLKSLPPKKLKEYRQRANQKCKRKNSIKK
mgnify:CR=1 FL=1